VNYDNYATFFGLYFVAISYTELLYFEGNIKDHRVFQATQGVTYYEAETQCGKGKILMLQTSNKNTAVVNNVLNPLVDIVGYV
jgi:hypothetical protein